MNTENQSRSSDVGVTPTSVVIVGAGPVGLSLARTLSDEGIDSIVLEKNERPDQYSRAILVPPRTLDIFEGWNLAETAKARGIFMPRLQAYGAESGKVAMTINFTELADVSRNAGYLILPQDRTEELLLRAVESTGRARVHFGTTLTGFSEEELSVTVEAANGKPRLRFRCQYLVGCDGAHSIVREKLHLTLVGKTYKARVLIADVSFSQSVPPTPRIALKAKGPLMMLQFDDTR